jgi:ankyrin repeat protein
LFRAATRGDDGVAWLLLENGADVVVRNNSGDWPPLAMAASMGETAVVQVFLEYNTDVNAKDSSLNGWTPLICAALGGYKAIVQVLLETGEVNADAMERKVGRR